MSPASVLNHTNSIWAPMDNDPASAAEQRANAVAKLRRAASLPRMKDGRRPPMHIEAVSDGEKFQVEDEQDVIESNNDRPSSPDPRPDSPPEYKPATPEPSSSGRRRRNRSRSRSRGSRDFKGKKLPQSPPPHSLTPSNDSSPDDSPPSPPPSLLQPSSVVAPIPSYFSTPPVSRVLMSPNFLSPGTPLLYPGSSPPTPLMPTLDAIQKGLLRSNSVAARMQALNKLTGGNLESQDPIFPSPSISPQPGLAKLGRNNTVSGGERTAARMKLFTALGERIKELDEGGTSGGEERPVVSTPVKRRRRRSARNSASKSNKASATDESEVLSTSTGTPTHPPTPLPYTQQPLTESVRTASTTPIPIQPISTPNINLDESIAGSRQTTPVRAVPNQWKRRSIVVEQDDDVAVPPQSTYPGLPITPSRSSPGADQRLPHLSDASSVESIDEASIAVGVPLYLSVRSPSRQDLFPSSPFATPHKEASLSLRDEGDDMESEEPEEVVYPAEHLRRSPYHDAYDRRISWIADPVPESNIAVHNEDDEDEEQLRGVVEEDDDQIPPESPLEEPRPRTGDSSPRVSSGFKELVVDTELSLEQPSASSSQDSSSQTTLNTTPPPPVGDESDSSQQAYPQRLSVASRIQSDRSPLATEFDADNSLTVPETPLKREGSLGTWSKMLGALTRSSSSNGRRSRTNSIATRERRQNTDSSISRESGGSLASPKADKNELGSTFPLGGQQSVMQSSSASTSMQSLALPTPPRTGVSPIPLASNLDMTKYNQDAKLFPFPGIKKLEEQRINSRNRRGLSISSSTPDIVLSLHGNENEIPLPSSSSSNTPSNSPDIKRDRVLAHQASDTHLLPKFKSLNSPPLSTAPSSSSHDYLSGGQIPNSQSPGSVLLRSLPTNREGVRKWLSNRFGSSTPTLASSSFSPNSQTIRPTAPSKKPSLSEILRWKKDNDLTSDWEDIGSPEKSRTPTSSTNGALLFGKPHNGEPSPVSLNGNSAHEDTQKTPRASKIAKSGSGISSSPAEPPAPSALGTFTSPTPSPPEPAPSSTPEPWSSLSDYPPQTTSESSSNTSSQYSEFPSKSAVIMERLDEMLGRGSKGPIWPSAIDDPPRKLLLAAPVLQVVNSDTVKDRFLFLFNDIFIVAKPIVQDPDGFLELTKPNPSDRKFVVKNVVLLRNLRFSGEREEPQSRNVPRNALTHSFVEQFTNDADQAIVSLFNNLGHPDDPVVLAQLFFRTPEIDRARLGDYLSRRTSRVVLKHYLDAFGFTGVRVDKALRIFLQTINIPTRAAQGPGPLDILLDSFASRWYDANGKQVAYDKDLAYRFSRAIVQLNEVLHCGISQEPGSTRYVGRNVTARDFLDAFRRQDPRGLLSDDILSDVYESIHREPLSQARHPSSNGPTEITVTFKRALPSRLTYKVQSEPVVVRIPQPDPNFTVELFGHSLAFEPPVLSFAKSSEASFRVTGTLFGLTTMLMLRSGSNALLYTGLPPSCPISVERAFMRNTFQVAFSNHLNAPRRYMFSFADPLVRHEWATSLKRLTDPLTSVTPAGPNSSPFQMRFTRAVGDIVFRVLQETLISPEAFSVQQSPEKLNNALKRLNVTSNLRHDFQLSLPSRDITRPFDVVRSKSRSKVYQHHAPGKLETESSVAPSHSRSSSENDGNGSNPRSRAEERLWSGKDLEMFCQQNSSIAQVVEMLLPAISSQPIQTH